MFLDVDGVLNSLRSMVAFHGARRDDLDNVAIRLLDRLCLTLAEAGYEPQVVVSSTWRMMYTRKSWWNELFAERGCKSVNVVSATPIFGDNDDNRRGREVLAWMAANGNGAPYVCLDDDSDFLPGQPLVLVNPSVGLQIADLNTAFRWLTSTDMPGLPPSTTQKAAPLFCGVVRGTG